MKKIFILISILFAIISCSEQPDTNVYHKTERTNDVYHVPVIRIIDQNDTVNLCTVVIDSCEYLIGNSSFEYQGCGYLSHKGNCKYCTERRKRELKNVK